MANLELRVPELTLNDGVKIPMLAFGTGTALKGRDAEKAVDREKVDLVKTAIGMGYYHIDCAEEYNMEREVGAAIRESKVPREQLFITSKWIDGEVSRIPQALDETLAHLKLDNVDLYLIHSPFGKTTEDLQEAWRALEKIKQSGKARSIGVSNYRRPELEATLEIATIRPSINQIEYHPYLQRDGGALIEYMRDQGIAVAAYGPLTPVTRAAPGPLDESMQRLAHKYGVTPGEIALRWVLDQQVVAITTSSKEQRLSDYRRCLAFQLTPAEQEDLRSTGMQKHFRAFWNKKIAPDDRS